MKTDVTSEFLLSGSLLVEDGGDLCVLRVIKKSCDKIRANQKGSIKNKV